MEFFLNSSEIDFLILLYLQECGLNHSYYVFKHEANLKSSIGNQIIFPPGSLVSLIQRGFVYSHLETEWFLKLQKNTKNSVQNLMQRRKKFLKSIKNESIKICKKLYISTQISHQKSILFCSWHPRSFLGYYSTRNSFNYIQELKKSMKSIEIFNQNFVPNNWKKNSISYEITSIDFNILGTLVVTTFYNGLFIIWSETGIPLYRNIYFNRPSIESKWSENSRNLALAFLSGEIGIWSSWYLQTIFIILPHRTLLVCLDWKESENLLASSKNKILSALNFTKKKIQTIKAHDLQINDLVYSTEKKIIGSCSDDMTIKLWKLEQKLEFLGTFRGHKKEVLVILFKPINFCKVDSTEKWTLISGSLDFSIRIWDLNSKSCLKFLKLDGPVFSLEWNIFSEFVAIGTCDKICTLDFKNQFKDLYIIDGEHGIFSILSHPMVNKFIGFSHKKIFLF